MYLSTLIIENFRCFGSGTESLKLYLRPGLTALVGENDAGKSAVIDAMRFALGTTDQEWYRLDDTDFYNEDTNREIKITCKFEDLNARDNRAFIEYLTYSENENEKPVLYINWIAKDTGEKHKGQPYRRVEICSGKDGNGPSFVQEVRELLRAIYLRPLRDAEQALSAGRGSRLAQILRHTDMINTGENKCCFSTPLVEQNLSVLGIGDLINTLLEKQEGIVAIRDKIDAHLNKLSLNGSDSKSNIKVSGSTSSSDVRLRQLLEKLNLVLDSTGKPGLGSNNILFIACELLLLIQEEEGNKLLLIEEPEAHLHPQRQLRVMQFLQKQAEENSIQIIITTHSPNLASVIKLDNLVMIQNKRAFPMDVDETKLEQSDYRFLQRFLDVTKANLFFARGVMIVEGDAENILLPTLAKLIDRDFTEHGVSIVNVGGVGLRRYARIFQRKNVVENGQLNIPVACVTDMDVMPDCAPIIIGKLNEGDVWPELPNNRKWRAKRDFNATGIEEYRNKKVEKASGQFVKTFVSDEWTLEYDLALGSRDEYGHFSGDLAQYVYISACLAEKDDEINENNIQIADQEKLAIEEFNKMKSEVESKDNCTREEVIASQIYAKFANKSVSKSIAAQYLAEQLQNKDDLTGDILRAMLPKYLVDAIDYVTSSSNCDEVIPTEEAQ